MKAKHHKKALLLSYATVGYNLVEGVIAVGAGIVTNSTALLAFGLDSFIESLSGSVMIWRFAKHRSDEDEQKAEQKAQKLVAYTFFILGTYVLIDATLQLISGNEPEKSLFGIVIAILSLAIMPSIALAKYRLGKQINSKSLVADSKQTLACVIMSVTLLIGVGLNYAFGLWWADPIAGLAIAVLLFHEGKEALEGEDDE